MKIKINEWIKMLNSLNLELKDFYKKCSQYEDFFCFNCSQEQRKECERREKEGLPFKYIE